MLCKLRISSCKLSVDGQINNRIFLRGLMPCPEEVIRQRFHSCYIILNGGVSRSEAGVVGYVPESGGEPAHDWSQDSERGGV